jgi:HTH-type transcriptional regulator/antitoxin HipB
VGGGFYCYRPGIMRRFCAQIVDLLPIRNICLIFLHFYANIPEGEYYMQISTTTNLGLFIRQLRKDLGLTQKQLALASGTGLRFIIDLEKGKDTCQVGKVLMVLRMLGVVVEYTPPIPLS